MNRGRGDTETRGSEEGEMGLVNCPGYRRDMSPEDCLKNQMSLYCLDGFPCHSCGVRTRLAVPARAAGAGARPTTPETANQKPETGFSAAAPQKTENSKQKTIFQWPKHLKNATAAVRRAWMEK